MKARALQQEYSGLGLEGHGAPLALPATGGMTPSKLPYFSVSLHIEYNNHKMEISRVNELIQG